MGWPKFHLYTLILLYVQHIILLSLLSEVINILEDYIACICAKV